MTSTTRPLRAVIYSRYSTDKQNPESINDQNLHCRQYIQKQGWQLTAVYADPAKSGRHVRRPEYNKLLKDAAAGKFDVVVSESVDRLSRRLSLLMELHEQLKYRGITLHTPTLGELSEIHVAVLGLVAQMVISETSLHVRRRQEAAVQQSQVVNGLAYGYDTCDPKQNNGLNRSINEEEAEVVREIFRLYAAGLSPQAIARKLNEQGITRRGHEWHDTTIRGQFKRSTGVLRNHLYRGIILWNRASYATDPRTDSRTAKLNPEEDWVQVHVPELQIIDDKTWGKVQKRMANLREKTAHGDSAARPRYLLSGLCVCSACQASYTTVGDDRLGCYRRHRKKTCGNDKTIKRSIVEERVLDCLKTVLLSPENVDRFLESYAAQHRASQQQAIEDRKRRERDKVRVEQAIERLLVLVEEGSTPDSVSARLRDREAELAQINNELAAQPAPEDDIVVQLPNLAQAYQRKIRTLAETLCNPTLGLGGMRD